MPSKINWSEIEPSNILVHKDDTVVRVEFLDAGTQEAITLDDGKQVVKYLFKVKDLDDKDKEKELSYLSKRFLYAIKPFIPIKGKRFAIEKYRFGKDDFDIDFRIREI